MNQKRTILTQELLQIMKNCSPNLNLPSINHHINHFLKRMQFSGYNKEMRFDVYNSTRKAYQIKKEASLAGEMSLNRPKEWNRVGRKKLKEEKKKSYRSNDNESVIFVSCTPNGGLKKKFEEEIRKSAFKIKVVENLR